MTTSIAAKFKAFGNNVQANAQVFGAKVQANAQVFGAKVQNAAKDAKRELGEIVQAAIDPKVQQRNEKKFDEAIDAGYAKIGEALSAARAKVSTLTNKAAKKMKNEGVFTLRAPIASMQNLNIGRLEIREDMTSNQKRGRKIVNELAGYHENVSKTSEKASRVAGTVTHSLVRNALTPIRLAAKVCTIPSAGKVIQNSVALAAGFLVRGLVLAVMQLGHMLPYLAAAAVVGGIGAGLVALAIANPLAAVVAGGFLIGGAYMVYQHLQNKDFRENDKAQQLQIKDLGNKVDDLTNETKKLNTQIKAQSNSLPSMGTVLKTATVVGGAALAFINSETILDVVSNVAVKAIEMAV